MNNPKIYIIGGESCEVWSEWLAQNRCYTLARVI